MSLVGLLVVVIIIGLVLWLIQQLPLEQPFKTVALVLIVLIAIVWLLGGIPFPRLTVR